MTEYDPEQLTAGFRSMTMLTALVLRGGGPAPVASTIPLRAAEKQYGWLPVKVGGAERRVAVITNLRLVVGEEIPLWAITRIRPGTASWSVALEIRGRQDPLVLSGPWVPWMSVVICAELYNMPWPPGYEPTATVPAPRRASAASPTRQG